MREEKMDLIAEQLAEIRTIIIDREGQDVQDQFEIDGYLICINIPGCAYGEEDLEAEDEKLLTLIQVEKGPLGMEELIACALEEEREDEPDHYVILGPEPDKISETLDGVREIVYRHWHWLDLPSTLDGEEDLWEEDDLDLQ